MNKIKKFFEIKRIYLVLFIALTIKTIGGLSVNNLLIAFIVFLTYLTIFHKSRSYARRKKEKRMEIKFSN